MTQLIERGDLVQVKRLSRYARQINDKYSYNYSYNFKKSQNRHLYWSAALDSKDRPIGEIIALVLERNRFGSVRIQIAGEPGKHINSVWIEPKDLELLKKFKGA